MKPNKQGFFNNIAGEFDNHVRQSIPLFGRYVDMVADYIVEFHKHGKVLDICGSTGELGRILFSKGFKGVYYNLDGSPQMINIADKNRPNMNHRNILAGFMCSWTDESGIFVPEFEPQVNDFDVVVEHLGFQFFTKERLRPIEYIRRKFLKPDGVFITCEKFTSRREGVFEANEALKDEYKRESFTEEQMAEKKATVLNDMHEYLCEVETYINILSENFFNVRPVYKAGNFAAFICTQAGYIHIPYEWISSRGLIKNRFNAR